MTVTYFGAGTRVNSSGSAVASISTPRPASIAVGDYVILFGYTDKVDNWILSVGDGIPFEKLGQVGGFQVWGKFLGPGFGSTTAVSFVHNSIVYGMTNLVWRGARSHSRKANGGTLVAPSIYPPGSTGRAVRLFGATTGSGTAGLTAAGTTRLTGDIRDVPMLVTDAAFSFPSLVGTVTATKTGSASLATKLAMTICLSPDAPPNAPTLTAPTNAATIDRTTPTRFKWDFSSDVPGDAQSAFVLNWRNAGNTASGTVTSETPTQHVDIDGGTFPADSLQWTVRTAGTFGIYGPDSSTLFFTSGDHPTGPTVTYPTTDGTVNQTDHIDWSVTSQDAYQVRRVGDTAGAADTGTIYFDTGEVADTGNLVRSLALAFETNNRIEHLQMRVKLAGVWSSWADVRVLVSYTPPPVAALLVQLGADGVSIDLNYSVPAGVGGQPDATSVDIFMSTDGGATSVRYWGDVATSGVVNYPLPASGVDYVFQIVATADNGTTSATDWITRGGLGVDAVH